RQAQAGRAGAGRAARKVELLLSRSRDCPAAPRRGCRLAGPNAPGGGIMTKPETLPKVLFLCTHNSARSQMAEGLLRHLAGDRFVVHSAGTEAPFVRPEAIAAIAELGVVISDQESETLE